MLNISNAFLTLVIKRLNDQYDLFNNKELDVFCLPFIEDKEIVNSIQIRYGDYEIIAYNTENKNKFRTTINNKGPYWPVVEDFDNGPDAVEYIISTVAHIILEPEKIDKLIKTYNDFIETCLNPEGNETC